MRRELDHRMEAFGELRLMVTIVDWAKAKGVGQIMGGGHKPLFLCRAYGTAGSDLMDLLGLGAADKALLLGFYPGPMIPRLQEELHNRTNLKKAGKGISFSVPVSGMKVSKHHRAPNHLGRLGEHMEQEADSVNETINHDLIVAVVEEGGTDQVMAAARSAGAKGGTSLRALRFGMEDVAKLFGFPLQEKKDVVAILTHRAYKQRIMEAVSSLEEQGGRSILFSLPAANVMGLSPEESRFQTNNPTNDKPEV